MTFYVFRYDPSNPVVCMSGITRRDLYSRMSTAIASADLVLVLGTSLSGLNADQVKSDDDYDHDHDDNNDADDSNDVGLVLVLWKYQRPHIIMMMMTMRMMVSAVMMMMVVVVVVLMMMMMVVEAVTVDIWASSNQVRCSRFIFANLN